MRRQWLTRSFVPTTLTRPTALTAPALFLWLTLLTTAFSLGCAKFNLFYNAETAFAEAEKLGEDIDPRNQPTSTQKTKYQRCIAKCKLVLEEYPNSAYVDDALFLIGKSRFRLKEWGEALNRFDNLLANFPNSEFVEETMYLKSLALISRGDEDAGLDWFARLREAFPEGRFGTEALYRLGDAYAEKERYEDAARYYREFLESHPDHEATARVVAALGRAYYDAGEFEKAAAVLADIDRDKLTQSEFFESEWLRLAALNDLGRADEAAEELDDLERVAQTKDERGRMLLLKGRIQLAQGNEDEGLFTLESILKQFEGEQVTADAQLAIVEYLLRVEGPEGERFRSQVETTVPGRVQGKAIARLRTRQNQLKRFDRSMQALEEADSNAWSESFRVAESLYIDFKRPGEALEYYQRVLDEAPESPLAPRAAYAIAYIEQNALGDSVAAEAAFARLAADYPESPQARSLRGEEFLEAIAPTVVADAAPSAPGGRGGNAGVAAPRQSRARFAADWPLRRGGPGAARARDRR